ncbi:adenylyltransferase/cytidyltransferase family protein [Devosia sp.]|uniref:adenylyltransferase/cytidyltransferase family protein n=1 Tax=Devosia sp. TaxID=1871048 RepID=UPI003BA96FF2
MGFARELNFLPGDTDVDVRIGLEFTNNRAAFDAVVVLVRLFAQNGFRLMRETYLDGRPMQTAFAHRENDNTIFDIYYFYSGVSEGRYVNANDFGYRRKPRHLIDNKKSLSWPGYATLKVNVPQPVEDYLAWRFGPEWRTPKKNWELGPVDNACIEPLPQVTVLTYGTWDLFHQGHLRLLERAAALGDHLVVGVVSDELCAIKGKQPSQDEATRAAAIHALPFVREVFIQRMLDQKEFDIERFGAAHLVVGDDWINHPRFEQVRDYRGVELHYLPRTPGISSTSLRAELTAGSRGP